MAEFDAPQSRNEAILQNILGADNVLLPPQSRNEAILQNILGADNVLLPPQSRIEELLMQLLEEWPVGPQEVPENDVNFYGYDGSIVASYTAAQFAALEEMPENPDHTADGLTSQGWNWSLANAKAYVAKYGRLNIGQMYVPTDGKTHVFINIQADDPSYETTLYFGHTTASGQTVIDWGDGSPTETASSSSAAEHSHTYVNPGGYEVTLDTVNGVMSIIGTNNSRTGTHFAGSGGYARNLSRIEKIHFASTVSIENNAFSNCYALQSVTIPEGVTSIGTYAFSNCYTLQSVTIPDSVTSIGSNAFTNCYALQSVTIPDGVTSIGTYAFSNCYALQSVTIPDSVTSIGNNAFSNCYALQSVTIPDGVTSIENNAFAYCYGIIVYHIKSTTPPTLSKTNAFTGISTDTVFYVPANSLNTYKTANNWSTYANRMVAE